MTTHPNPVMTLEETKGRLAALKVVVTVTNPSDFRLDEETRLLTISDMDAALHHLNTLQQWKDSALQAMASWDEVSKFIRETSRPEDLGKSVASVVLNRLQKLEAGKRTCQCNNLKIALRDGALQLRAGIPSIGGCYIQHCPWCGGTISPQPSQQEGQ